MRERRLHHAGPRWWIVAMFAVLLATAALAGPLSPAARGEIEALLARLEVSGCQFNRNGSWYSAAQAKAHLQRKLEYLENKATRRVGGAVHRAGRVQQQPDGPRLPRAVRRR